MNVAIRYKETATLNASEATSEVVDTDKQMQAALSIDPIGNKTYGNNVYPRYPYGHANNYTNCTCCTKHRGWGLSRWITAKTTTTNGNDWRRCLPRWATA